MMLITTVPGKFSDGLIHGRFTSYCNASSSLPSVSQCLPRDSMEQVSKRKSFPLFKDKRINNINSLYSGILPTGVNAEIETNTSIPIAPLTLKSSAGQFLVSTLQSNPHLFDSAADHELDLIAAEQEEALQETPEVSRKLHALYRRVADVKTEERRETLGEVMYALVIQKFLKAGITLTPGLSIRGKRRNLGSASHEKQLETIHSLEALGMIKDHLYSVIEGKKGISLKPEQGSMEISEFKAGQLYASSIVYGYFIRRVDRKFQLERRMEDLSFCSDRRRDMAYTDQIRVFIENDMERYVASGLNRLKGTSGVPTDEGFFSKPRKLRDYVSSFDLKTLDQCMTLRYKESLDVLEKQAEALFGNSIMDLNRLGSIVKIHLSCSQLRLLVLEAVAFGSFLFDEECHVESKCTLHPISNEI